MEPKNYNHDKYLSAWLSRNMPPPSTGALITDIDFVVTKLGHKKAAIIEKKAWGETNKKWQDNLIADLQKGLQASGWQCSSFIIQFENNGFHDGKAYLNLNHDEPITEEEFKTMIRRFCS